VARNRVVELVRPAFGAWSFTVGGVPAEGLSLTVSRDHDVGLQGGDWLPVRVQQNGEPVTATVGGTLPAGSLISVEGNTYRLRDDFAFGVGPSFTNVWAFQNRLLNDFLWALWGPAASPLAYQRDYRWPLLAWFGRAVRVRSAWINGGTADSRIRAVPASLFTHARDPERVIGVDGTPTSVDQPIWPALGSAFGLGIFGSPPDWGAAADAQPFEWYAIDATLTLGPADGLMRVEGGFRTAMAADAAVENVSGAERRAYWAQLLGASATDRGRGRRSEPAGAATLADEIEVAMQQWEIRGAGPELNVSSVLLDDAGESWDVARIRSVPNRPDRSIVTVGRRVPVSYPVETEAKESLE